MSNKQDITSDLDDFKPSPEERHLSCDRYKNLYLYVTKAQLASIISNPRLKLSRTSRTNDCTENLTEDENEIGNEVRRFGYICLSGTIASPMMWGQYAERSSGACLVFSGKLTSYPNNTSPYTINICEYIDRFSRKIKCDMHCLTLNKVHYSSERPQKGSNIYSLLSTKAPDWEHEKEYRIIVPLAKAIACKDDVFSFSYYYEELTPMLSRIVLGPLCDLDAIDVERSINDALKIGYKNTAPIRVTKAIIDPKRNRIIPCLDNLNKCHLCSVS